MEIISKFNIRKKRLFILDLDGTVYLDNKPIKNAIQFINQYHNQYDFLYITNNTSRSRSSYVDKLSYLGIINVSYDQIITPILPLLHYLNKNKIQEINCIGTDDFKDELKQSGIRILDTQTETAVLAYDTSIDYKKICAFSSHLIHAKRYLATHFDLVCPTLHGVAPDVGGFIKLFEASTNRLPDSILGKPNVDLVSALLSDYKNDEIIIVGDRLYTDKLLAENLGVDFALVLSGETKKRDLRDLEVQPSVVIEDLGEITKFK